MSQEFKPMQLAHIDNTGSILEIGAVTARAIMLKCDDGKWGGDGFKALWVPKSIITHRSFNDNRQNSQFGIHVISLPAWFANQHKNLL
jgi:hypothetical protein